MIDEDDKTTTNNEEIFECPWCGHIKRTGMDSFEIERTGAETECEECLKEAELVEIYDPPRQFTWGRVYKSLQEKNIADFEKSIRHMYAQLHDESRRLSKLGVPMTKEEQEHLDYLKESIQTYKDAIEVERKSMK
jgi:hypothetical protein